MKNHQDCLKNQLIEVYIKLSSGKLCIQSFEDFVCRLKYSRYDWLDELAFQSSDILELDHIFSASVFERVHLLFDFLLPLELQALH